MNADMIIPREARYSEIAKNKHLNKPYRNRGTTVVCEIKNTLVLLVLLEI